MKKNNIEEFKKLSGGFLPWIKKQFNFSELISGFSENHDRINPQISLDKITNELFNMGFAGECSINEHFNNPMSDANQICSQGHFYQLLNHLSFESGREKWFEILKQKKRDHYFDEFFTLGDKLLLSIDGWEINSSYVKHCDECLYNEYSDGSIRFYHSYLVASIIHPYKPISIILDIEPSVSKDSNDKQDCEIKQIKRLLKRLHDKAKPLWDIVLLDSLYPVASVLNLINTECNKDYYVVMKNKRLHAYEEAQCKLSYLPESKIVTDSETITAKKTTTPISTINNADHEIFSVEAVIEKKKNSSVDYWLWLTSIKNKTPLKNVAIARRRWQGEEFNNLFEDQHHIYHVFSHKSNSMKTLPLILMISSSLIQFFLLRKRKPKFSKTESQISPLKGYKYFLKYLSLIIRGIPFFNSS